jgi:KDPG and KHG aldolase
MSRTKSQVLQLMRVGSLVPVLRDSSAEDAFELSLAIADAGIYVLEITITVPDALLVVSRVKKERAELLVGADSVLGAATAQSSIDSGAKYLRSLKTPLPHIDMIRPAASLLPPRGISWNLVHSPLASVQTSSIPTLSERGAAKISLTRLPNTSASSVAFSRTRLLGLRGLF